MKISKNIKKIIFQSSNDNIKLTKFRKKHPKAKNIDALCSNSEFLEANLSIK